MVQKDEKSGKVKFICSLDPTARRVYLAGDFNDWDPEDRRMVKVRDGSFRANLELEPGTYQYKFVVDGEWMPDPSAREQVPNEHGTTNSVIRV